MFWANQPGDIFLKHTMMKLGLDPTVTTLAWYSELKKVPRSFDVDDQKRLIIKERVTKVVDDVEIEEEDITSIIDPVIYFDAGIHYKQC